MLHTGWVAGPFVRAMLAAHMHVLAAGTVPGLVLNIDATVAALAITAIAACAGVGGVLRAIHGHTVSGVLLIIVGIVALGLMGGSAVLGGPIAHALNQMGA